MFTVTSEQHAKSVVDQIGWTSATRGACAHGLSAYIRRFWLIDYICTIENARRTSTPSKPADSKQPESKEPAAAAASASR